MFKLYQEENAKKDFSFCSKFGDWLDKYISDEAASIRAFSDDISQRNRVHKVKQSKTSWLAPLNLVEHGIGKTVEASSVRIQQELRCKGIRLKKRVMNDNRATRDENAPLLLTKKLFDFFFDDDFYNRLVDEVGHDVFFAEKSEAVQASLAYDAEYKEKMTKQYKEWIGRKRESKKQQEARQVGRSQSFLYLL